MTARTLTAGLALLALAGGAAGQAPNKVPSYGSEFFRFALHTTTVFSGALSPDGTLAATAGGSDNEMFLWKTADATLKPIFGGKSTVNMFEMTKLVGKHLK